MAFDYDNAEQDIYDAGGDPDYLSHTNSAERDRYMEKMGLDSKDYGGGGNKGSNNNSNKNSGGCYIATAVYGSYDCPQVWMLRRYRDFFLDERFFGRLFIKTYYSISPSLVKRFGHTKWFQATFRKFLDKKVDKLSRIGVSDQPYRDRY